MRERLWTLVIFALMLRLGMSAHHREAGLFTEPRGIESETVRELARELGIDPGRDLEEFRVFWCHQTAPHITVLSNYVAGGRGLLLSGSAVTLVNQLGLDTIQTTPVTFGDDRAQAGLTPVATDHPAFQGLSPERGVIWLNNVVYPAFAPIRSSRGRILASGSAGPVVEYQLGRGRIITCPWRLSPLYYHAARGYRDNLERLLANLLGYLGDPNAPRTAPSPQPETGRDALALAIDDLCLTFGDRYPRGAEFRQRLPSTPDGPALEELRREALLANPLLDFDRLLLVKRGADKLGLPTNYQGNSSLDPEGYTNEIAILSPVRPAGKLATLYRPDAGRFAGDVRLHFDADRLLFSMPDSNHRWRVFELNADGSGLRMLPLINEPDVDNYDACYLPAGRIIFSSTAPFTGVPCVRGSAHVANLYRLDPDGRIRQLTVEQDHDWCPTPLPSGRVLYLRWEYTDLPHAFSRILFHMNPDGTEQMEFYGSNSYWPASLFYAKPLPGQDARFVGIVGGHHDLPRMGDLVLFDAAKGRFEAAGAVQRIPGRGRPVLTAVLDLPIEQTWPKFLHPFPLNDKYFLVSCQPSAGAPWGIYLADVFDNLVLICERPGWALLEPVPLRRTECPPVVADKTDLERRDAEVFLADVYAGPGLKGVPRGLIKSLRLVSYHFAYQGVGGEPDAPGLDGPWDIKQVLGTVPVCDDGSARFRIPAYTPIALQPLDAAGQAVQLMRSWFTAMPGEVVSCVGCHEPQNTAPPARSVAAATRPPESIRPWYGPGRGFDFRREVQPVLDRFCVGCHTNLTDQPARPMQANQNAYNLASRFTPAYYALRRLVRTPTRESDMRLLPPWEFHAETTRLVQMLRGGHHGVALDSEAWDRLITWIDLGAPAHGTWTEICGTDRVRHQASRRTALRRRYTGMTEAPEVVHLAVRPSVAPVVPDVVASAENLAPVPGRAKPHPVRTQAICLSDRIRLDLAHVDTNLWMSQFEITNEQFALFDPEHDSGLEFGDYIHFSPGERGWSLARPRQPVVRISWRAASDFCRWLSARTGRRFRLPTEAEWECACRAGTTTPFWYGTIDTDFSPYGNLSDRTHQAIDAFGWTGRPEVIPPWRPADTRFDDHARVSTTVGSYGPNPWGFYDMHGNVAEWTSSPAGPDRVLARGGSWYDPPLRCRADFRQIYRPDQGVYDVGFRVVCEID
jgi:formylglycine-generating enzyme required for sulfatase activity